MPNATVEHPPRKAATVVTSGSANLSCRFVILTRPVKNGTARSTAPAMAVSGSRLSIPMLTAAFGLIASTLRS